MNELERWRMGGGSAGETEREHRKEGVDREWRRKVPVSSAEMELFPVGGCVMRESEKNTLDMFRSVGG